MEAYIDGSDGWFLLSLKNEMEVIKTYFANNCIFIQWMSSISVETNNEKQLTVDEYVRYKKVQNEIQQILDNENIKEKLRNAEEAINGLSIDLIIKYSVNKKKY